MTEAAIEALLAELRALPAEERRRWCVADSNVKARFPELVEAVERKAIADVGEALEASSMLVDLARATGEVGLIAVALRGHAHALAYANQFDEALVQLGESADAAEQAGDEIASGQTQMAMLHVLNRMGRSDEAITAGRDALARFERAGAAMLAAKAEANLGVAYRTRNEPMLALASFERARRVLGNVPVAAAQLDSNRAEVLLELNRFAEAEASFEAALAAFEAAGVDHAVAIVEGNLADLMSRQGRLKRALYHFERAQRHFRDSQSPGDLARLDAERSDTLVTAGLADEAVDVLRAAIPALDGHGLALEAARARLLLARELARTDRVEASAVLEPALECFRRLGHRRWQGRALIAEAQITLRDDRAQDRVDDAFPDVCAGVAPLLAEALALLEGLPAETARVRHLTAVADLRSGDLAAAEAGLDEALLECRHHDLAPLLVDVLVTRAACRARRGAIALAIEDQSEAMEQVERLRGSLQAARLRSSVAGSRRGIYEDLVRMLLDEDGPESVARAFAVAERAKSRTLLDLATGMMEPLALDAIEDNDPRAAVILRDIVRHRGDLNALYSRLYDGDVEAPSPAQLAEWRTRIHACEEMLRTLEDRLAATEGVGSAFAQPVGIEAVRRELAPGSVLLEYFVAAGELLVFVVDAEGGAAVVRSLATLDEVTEATERVRFQMGRLVTYGADAASASVKLLDSAHRDLGALHAMIIAPVADRVRGAAHVHVVPHGPLHMVPFAALWDGERSLIDYSPVTCTPSASLLCHLSGGPLHDRFKSAVLMAAADELAPAIAREAAAVDDVLPGVTVRTGSDATLAAFAAVCGQADLLHLACHGRFVATDPMASGVRLSDGWLTVRDLYGLRLAHPLVILSGCDTAAASVDGGDDLVGLVRGFFAAGASTLVMSLWPLHDATALDLMADFHACVAEGEGVATALRHAQCAVKQRCPHPGFWASLVLHGRGRGVPGATA